MTGWEIEKLPQAETGKRMLRRVSPIYDNSIFMKFFYEGVGSQFDKVRAYFETLRNQSFPSTVDWAIECQERKYSITPDKTLTLAKRRERLKIKISGKRPLNPAVLEKYIAENYGVAVHLGEQEAGFITLELSHYEETAKFLAWLLQEKPAHLQIKFVVRKNMLAPFYAGVAHFLSGKKRIPQGERVYWEGRSLLFDDGERKIVITPPNVSDAFFYAGVAHFLSGKKRIPSADTLQAAEQTVHLDDGQRQFDITPAQVTLNEENAQRVIPVTDLGLSDALTLQLAFPSTQRILTLSNPRPDLTPEDVNEVADFVIKNEILLNNSEEKPKKLSQARLITITEKILF